jgi:deoxycytidine triphosphate deaminase
MGLCQPKPPTLPLIVPFSPDKTKAASYDLSVGAEYHMPQEEEAPGPSMLKLDTFIWIAPNAICTILSEETLNITDRLAAGLSLPLRLLRQGIIMAPQTQIDPGYSGKVVVLLYNLSDKPVKIRRGDHLVTIEFRKLDFSTQKPYGQGQYSGLSTLAGYVQAPLISSLAAMRRDLTNWQNRLLTSIPIALAGLSVTIALISLLVVTKTLGDDNDANESASDTSNLIVNSTSNENDVGEDASPNAVENSVAVNLLAGPASKIENGSGSVRND